MPQVTDAMLEAAARNLCLIRSVDPTSQVDIPGPDGQVMPMPAWHLFRQEILTSLQIQQAVQTGFNNLNPDGSPRIVLARDLSRMN